MLIFSFSFFIASLLSRADCAHFCHIESSVDDSRRFSFKWLSKLEKYCHRGYLAKPPRLHGVNWYRNVSVALQELSVLVVTAFDRLGDLQRKTMNFAFGLCDTTFGIHGLLSRER